MTLSVEQAPALAEAQLALALRVYTHLLPASEDRTRRAIDRAFGYKPDDADGAQVDDAAEVTDEPDDADGLGTA
jgi:hypothetical protein